MHFLRWIMFVGAAKFLDFFLRQISYCLIQYIIFLNAYNSGSVICLLIAHFTQRFPRKPVTNEDVRYSLIPRKFFVTVTFRTALFCFGLLLLFLWFRRKISHRLATRDKWMKLRIDTRCLLTKQRYQNNDFLTRKTSLLSASPFHKTTKRNYYTAPISLAFLQIIAKRGLRFEL